MTQTSSGLKSKIIDLKTYRVSRNPPSRNPPSRNRVDDTCSGGDEVRAADLDTTEPNLKIEPVYNADSHLTGDGMLDDSSSGELLQFSDRPEFEASIEIDNMDGIGSQQSPNVRDQVVREVYKILCHEFGDRRIKLEGRMFSTRHNDIDSLIAKLLRAQFYTKQISFSGQDTGSASDCWPSVAITWGVGRTVEEAVGERVKRGLQKKLRSKSSYKSY